MAKGKLTGKRRTFRLNNMTGLMNTMSELNAYLTFDPNAPMGAGLTQIPFEFQLVENWQPINRGGLSTATGFSLYKDTGSATKISGLYRYNKSDGTSLFMFSQGTKVYKLVSGTATDIGATIAATYIHFNTAQDKLVFCDGTNAPQKWDGTTLSNLSSGGDATACAGFKQTVYYQNRLFGFSATHDTSLLYYSKSGDITAGYAGGSAPDGGFINCDVNDGQKITAIGLFFIPGQLTPTIIVGKERSVGIITGAGSSGDPYTFSKISFDMGIPGFRQIVQFQQDIAFLTPGGVSSYQTAIKNINIQQQLLSGKITNQFTALSTTYLPDALGWFDWKNRRISYAVCTGTNTVPDTIWHYDIELGGWYKQTGFHVTAAFVDSDGTLYTGDDAGKIYNHSSSVQNYNGLPVSATLQTPPLDFYQQDYYKRIVHGKLTVRGNGNGSYSLGVSTSLNYGTRSGSTHVIPVTTGSYTWNGGVWTSDSSVYQWGGSPLKTVKFFPSNIFQDITFTFVQSGVNQPVGLLDMELVVEYLDLV
jgi:hypothetical protein